MSFFFFQERAHRNEASGNVHIKKMKLEDELEIAWEHYKELQKEGKDQEMQVLFVYMHLCMYIYDIYI